MARKKSVYAIQELSGTEFKTLVLPDPQPVDVAECKKIIKTLKRSGKFRPITIHDVIIATAAPTTKVTLT